MVPAFERHVQVDDFDVVDLAAQLLRKVINERKIFPTYDSTKKVINLAIREASRK